MDSETLIKILKSQSFDTFILDDIRSLQSEKDPYVLGTILITFLEDLTARVRAIKEAVEQGNPEKLAETAHTLKSSSSSVGIRKLAAISAELENMGRGSHLNQVNSFFSALESESRHIQREIALMPEVVQARAKEVHSKGA